MEQRFVIFTSKAIPNHWICFDKKNKIMCVFENEKFNETQEFKLIEDIKYDAAELAKIMREFGDYLKEFHYEKIFKKE
jgi:hypothetical protein